LERKTVTATKLGKKQMTIIQKDRSTQGIVLTDVESISELWVNLFFIGKALQNGFDIGNKGIQIFLVKGNTKYVFDCIMSMSKGFVVGVETVLSARQVPRGNVAIAALDKGKWVKMVDLHKLLTHVGEDARKAAKVYGWEVHGKLEPCDHCMMTKVNQKNLNKYVESKNKIAGEHLCIDTSSVKALRYGNKKFWLLIVDNCSEQSRSEFME
jgi:hypothetical protein